MLIEQKLFLVEWILIITRHELLVTYSVNGEKSSSKQNNIYNHLTKKSVNKASAKKLDVYCSSAHPGHLKLNIKIKSKWDLLCIWVWTKSFAFKSIKKILLQIVTSKNEFLKWTTWPEIYFRQFGRIHLYNQELGLNKPTHLLSSL